jgi:RNA polymerase sigma-70 factor (ECF subfamily)
VLAELPDRQRQAIVLRAAGGLSTGEIAATLGVSPGAAEQLLVRARATLRARSEPTAGETQ